MKGMQLSLSKKIAVALGVIVALAILLLNGRSREDSYQDFTTDAYVSLENGVERLRDGTFMVTSLVNFPNATSDMYKWWFTDYLQTTPQYQKWEPAAHKWMAWDHKKPSEIVGAHHLVHELIGGQMVKLRIQFVEPTQILGFDPSNQDTKAICAVVGELESSLNIAEMCHVARNKPWGVEVRSRFWMGVVGDRDAGPVKAAMIDLLANNPITRRIAVGESDALALQRHCIEEMSTLSSYLPEIYAKGHVALENSSAQSE
jgi:hypothetical protein